MILVQAGGHVGALELVGPVVFRDDVQPVVEVGRLGAVDVLGDSASEAIVLVRGVIRGAGAVVGGHEIPEVVGVTVDVGSIVLLANVAIGVIEIMGVSLAHRVSGQLVGSVAEVGESHRAAIRPSVYRVPYFPQGAARTQYRFYAPTFWP